MQKSLKRESLRRGLGTGRCLDHFVVLGQRHFDYLVSEFGERSQYIRNIQANPAVRVRIRGRWHDGVAHLVPDDDPHERLKSLPQFNSLGVRTFGTNLLTVRVDLTS